MEPALFQLTQMSLAIMTMATVEKGTGYGRTCS